VPPIDPIHLRARTAALAERFADPAAAAAGVRRLLDDYADRTHRASPRVAASGLANSFKAPAPVVRAIVLALREPVRADPIAGRALLAAVWAGGSREERRIAAELLGVVAPAQPAETRELLETWVLQIESGETADALAELGLGALARQDPAAHLEYARRWIAHPARWARRFAVALLRPLVKDRHWDNVPAAVGVLQPAMAEPDGEVRRALAELLADMGPKSPGEMARFLREQAARSSGHTHWIVRNAMTGLPAAEQAEIVRVLRS
jgi:hypothetical protein